MKSNWGKVAVTIFLIIVLGVVKVHLHFIKLLLLLALGLLGLWLLRMLTQNWNRITASSSNINPLSSRPILSGLLAAASRGKRSLSSKHHYYSKMATTKRSNFSLEDVLHYDQLGCARKFICYLASVNSKKYSPIENDTVAFVESTPNIQRPDSSSVPLTSSMKLGKRYQNVTVCNNLFRNCPYANIQLHQFYVQL